MYHRRVAFVAAAAAILLMAGFVPVGQSVPSYPSKNQNKTIKLMGTLITPFLTASQFNTLLNVISNDVYNGASASTIQTDVQNTVLSSLTTAQYSQAMGTGLGLVLTVGMTQIYADLAKVVAVLGDNCGAFFDQLKQYVSTLKSTHQPAGIYKNAFRLTNSWLTLTRVDTIITRIKNNFTTSEWNKYRNPLNSYIRFTKYGL